MNFNNGIEGITFCPPQPADMADVLDLTVRCDIAEYGEADTDLEDLEHDWGQIDLDKDAWLAVDEAGRLAGYAAVLPWGDDLRYQFCTDPDWPGVELGQALLARCESRGAEIVRERGSQAQVNARAFIADVNKVDKALVEGAGFEPGRFYAQMWMEMDRAPAAPIWPEGVTVRPAVDQVDDRAIYALIETAFDRSGRKPTSFEDWKSHMKRPEIYDPDFWRLARAGVELIGACLAFQYSTGGWVRQLGVDAGWRRQGIGAALLQEIFGVFYRRGVPKVGLSVESYRPDAFRFYKRVGMRQVRQYNEYIKEVGL